MAEILIVTSKVKNYIKEAGMNTAASVAEALSEKVRRGVRRGDGERPQGEAQDGSRHRHYLSRERRARRPTLRSRCSARKPSPVASLSAQPSLPYGVSRTCLRRGNPADSYRSASMAGSSASRASAATASDPVASTRSVPPAVGQQTVQGVRHRKRARVRATIPTACSAAASSPAAMARGCRERTTVTDSASGRSRRNVATPL